MKYENAYNIINLNKNVTKGKLNFFNKTDLKEILIQSD